MKSLISTLSLITLNLAIPPSVLAQFYYPASSFFNPTANLYRGGKQDIVEWLTANDFQVFGFLLSINNFRSELNNDKNTITIFAPTDDAFATLPTEVRDKLSKPEKLQEFLKYHLVDGAIGDRDIKQGEVITLSGSTLKIDSQTLGNQNIRIKLNDVTADKSIKLNNNLIIIVVDEVLLPPNF